MGALFAVFVFSFAFLYVLGGHALIYGPHLFIVGFLLLILAPIQLLYEVVAGKGEHPKPSEAMRPQQNTTRSRPGPPCPECGEPLRTSKARQCFNCGADWHQEDTADP